METESVKQEQESFTDTSLANEVHNGSENSNGNGENGNENEHENGGGAENGHGTHNGTGIKLEENGERAEETAVDTRDR